jgi:flagellar biosynthesis/type III secretory pathway chaperone
LDELRLRELTDILDGEVELLQKLHTILSEQQAALVKGDVEAIRRNVEGEIKTLNQIGRLEERREATFEALRKTGDDGKITRLQNLIEEVGGQDSSRLRKIRTSLQETLIAIGKVNKHNGMLINQSLSYIDRTLRMIAGEDDTSKVYTPEGEVKCRTGQIVVNRKI